MKKLLVVGLFLALLIPRLAFGEPDETGCAVGSIFIFGTYEQDNDTTNGKEPIEWIILDKRDDGSLVLLSKYALDAKPYNTEYTDVTWETCSLRAWLNEEFYNAAFNAEEQAKIVPVTLENEDNPEHGTKGGKATEDKVWLLSIKEACAYFINDASMRCAPTEYAVAQGVFQSSSYTVDGAGACWWWLRSPGSESALAANVYFGGTIFYFGSNVSRGINSIRPVVVALPLPTDDVLYSQQRESELPISEPTPTPVPTYVYCNDNGKYYHVEGCRYAYSTTPKVTLNAAINAGKTACPVCIGYYGTPGGKWYHMVSNCQGMTNAITQTKADWEKAGKTACPVCMNETANEVQNTSAPTETQVYCAGGNENFHVLSDCRGMKNATQMGISKAVSMSKTACKYCMLPAKVFVFATQNGTYYHTLATCQGMEGAQYVTAKRAISAGKRPCPKCDASKLFATSTDTQTTPQNTSPTPMPVGMYSQVNSSTQKSDWMLDKSTRIKNGISQLEILTGENGGSVISFTGWSYGNREGFDGMTNNVCYVYVINEKGDAVFYETAKAPGASGVKHTLKNGHNMEYADFTCVLDVSAYSNGTYSLGSCNHFMISGNTFYHGYTFGDAYSFTVMDGIVTSMGGVEN